MAEKRAVGSENDSSSDDECIGPLPSTEQVTKKKKGRDEQ